MLKYSEQMKTIGKKLVLRRQFYTLYEQKQRTQIEKEIGTGYVRSKHFL